MWMVVKVLRLRVCMGNRLFYPFKQDAKIFVTGFDLFREKKLNHFRLAGPEPVDLHPLRSGDDERRQPQQQRIGACLIHGRFQIHRHTGTDAQIILRQRQWTVFVPDHKVHTPADDLAADVKKTGILVLVL